MKGTVIAFLVRLLCGVHLYSRLPATKHRRIYFANHSSHLDFVVIWASLPRKFRHRTRPVAAAEYWQKGAIRRWVAKCYFRAVLIPREAAKMREQNPVDLMSDALSEGSDLILFPEGTRGSGDRIAKFKSGFYHLAKRHPDAELVPVCLDNLNRILPKGEFIPIPLMGRIKFGPATGSLREGESKADFLIRCRDVLVELSGGEPSISKS